ncbi:MAG: TPM domain-containing protein [Syntrophales bacterium LBB04]|nr:TPM domain-containing protein [Syntrophales bacterium LBB04]
MRLKKGHRSSAALQFILMIFAVLAMLASAARGSEIPPKPSGAVNDFAQVIPAPYARNMEDLARQVLEKTGTAIVVATLPTIGDQDIAEYANRLYGQWGIGKKGQDKGVLILLALRERRIRIETGYGVEGILPDGLVGAILDKDVLPYLKEGNYGQALDNAMAAVPAVVAKDAGVTLTPPAERQRPPPVRQRPAKTLNLLHLIVLLLVLIPLLGTRQGRAMIPWIMLMFLGGGRGGGGFGGFGGGGFGGFGGGSSGGGGADRGF